jgi:hypothetical protein
VSPSSSFPGRLRRRLRYLHRRLVLRSFALETIRSQEFDDEVGEMLEDRIMALEEIVAAGWPRRMILRRRLARSLRASADAHAWAGPDFRSRRIEAASLQVIAQSARRRASRRTAGDR